MNVRIEKEAAVLEQMPVGRLREKYAEVFKEQARSWNRTHLVRRIAWRMQAEAEGDLSERARSRVAELANEADLRTNAPRTPKLTAGGGSIESSLIVEHDDRIPMPGTIITRRYKGKTLKVRVLPEGFEYEDEVYTSLTALVSEITGAHWNGYDFFKLGKRGGNGNEK